MQRILIRDLFGLRVQMSVEPLTIEHGDNLSTSEVMTLAALSMYWSFVLMTYPTFNARFWMPPWALIESLNIMSMPPWDLPPSLSSPVFILDCRSHAGCVMWCWTVFLVIQKSTVWAFMHNLKAQTQGPGSAIETYTRWIAEWQLLKSRTTILPHNSSGSKELAC